MIVRFARRAFLDIAEIEEWIARSNPHAAVRQTNKIYAACHALSRNPMRYPVIGGKAFRKRVVGSYVIVYRLTETVDIARVFHAARDWPNLLQS